MVEVKKLVGEARGGSNSSGQAGTFMVSNGQKLGGKELGDFALSFGAVLYTTWHCAHK